MKNNFEKNFIRCGICGWCLEILWTGFQSLRKREMQLFGRTSLLMFPIYGSAALILPVYRKIKEKSLLFRGLFYTIMIYCMEFASGRFLGRHGICPWDYSDSRFHYKGVIRLDYAPLWFFTGLLFEKLLKKSD